MKSKMVISAIDSILSGVFFPEKKRKKRSESQNFPTQNINIKQHNWENFVIHFAISLGKRTVDLFI